MRRSFIFFCQISSLLQSKTLYNFTTNKISMMIKTSKTSNINATRNKLNFYSLFQSHESKIFYCLLGYLLYKAYRDNAKAYCINEDNVIQKIRNQINEGIYHIEKEYESGEEIVLPEVIYDIKDNKYTIEFLIDQRKCDLFAVFAAILQAYEHNKESSGISIKGLSFPKQQQQEEGNNVLKCELHFEHKSEIGIVSKGTIYLIGENTLEKPNFRLILEKTNDITEYDLKAFLAAYKEANKPGNDTLKKWQLESFDDDNDSSVKKQKIQGKFASKTPKESMEHLQKLGVTIYLPDQTKFGLDWDYLGGYQNQKRDIEDTILLALKHPEIYDNISKGTRVKPESNRPRAVLFEGPPGTGKTTSAKIIAQQVKIPLLYLPIESIMSKYYGESERNFGEIFDHAKNIGKTVIFIDEIDSIASTRENSELHETSKRILSTLLRKIDGFESNNDILLVCATNRKQDLDSAVLSRIDMTVKFDLPDYQSRILIFQRYAKHLSNQELKVLANKSEHMSGRNISDICKDSERRWASKLIRKEVNAKLPKLEEYMNALESRISQNLV